MNGLEMCFLGLAGIALLIFSFYLVTRGNKPEYRYKWIKDSRDEIKMLKTKIAVERKWLELKGGSDDRLLHLLRELENTIDYVERLEFELKYEEENKL